MSIDNETRAPGTVVRHDPYGIVIVGDGPAPCADRSGCDAETVYRRVTVTRTRTETPECPWHQDQPGVVKPLPARLSPVGRHIAPLARVIKLPSAGASVGDVACLPSGVPA